MPIPTEPVGSLPRPMKLQKAYADYDNSKIKHEELESEQDAACLNSIKRMKRRASPSSPTANSAFRDFATYPLTDTLAGTGLGRAPRGGRTVLCHLHDGHHRQLPRLTGGPFEIQDLRGRVSSKRR